MQLPYEEDPHAYRKCKKCNDNGLIEAQCMCRKAPKIDKDIIALINIYIRNKPKDKK